MQAKERAKGTAQINSTGIILKTGRQANVRENKRDASNRQDASNSRDTWSNTRKQQGWFRQQGRQQDHGCLQEKVASTSIQQGR